MTRAKANGQSRGKGAQDRPYGFPDSVERAIVFHACTKPGFMLRTAHAVRPELLHLPECRHAMESAQTILRDTGLAPTSKEQVFAHVARRREDGTLKHEEVMAVCGLFDVYDGQAVPDAAGIEEQLAATLRARIDLDTAYAAASAIGTGDTSEVKELLRRKEALGVGETWPVPTPLAPTAGPPLSADALPDPLRSYALALAESLQVPLDMTAAAVLGALSAAAARKAKIEPAPGHVEPLNLFVVVVSASGQRKSAVFAAAATKPLADYERAKADERAADVRERHVEREKLEHERNAEKKKGNWARVAEIDHALELKPELHHFRLLAGDATAQALGTLLHQQGGRIAVVDAEPGAFTQMAGRYSKGEPELDVYLRGHAGDTLRVDRVSKERPPEYVEAPALTLLLGAQPDAVRALASVDGAVGRGLLGRILWCVANDVRGTRDVRRAQPVPAAVASAYGDCLRKLLDRPAALDVEGLDCLTFDAEAQRLWYDFAEGVERRVAPGGDLRDISGGGDGWGDKFAGFVARIAGLFHLAAQAAAARAEKTNTVAAAPTEKVTADTLRMAIRVGEWALAHARVAFGVAGSSPGVAAAQAILDHLRRAPRVEEWSQHDVKQALRSKALWAKAEALDPGFKLLAEHGWIRPPSPSGLKKTGRPSIRFVVNPTALDTVT